MRSLASFDFRVLSSFAKVEHALDDGGRVLLASLAGGDGEPFTPFGASAFGWTSADDGHGWILRTRGEPLTVRNVREAFGALIDEASEEHGIDDRILAVTIACESGPYLGPPTERQLRAPRTEKGYPDRAGENDPGDGARDALDWLQSRGAHSSHGIMQTLIATATAAVPTLFASVPPEKHREVLWSPRNSMACGAAFLADFPASVLADPCATRAKYGAGGVYPSTKNPFGVRLYAEQVMTRWIAFWNDLAALEAQGA